MDIKWKKELSLTERISWDRKKREDWCKNQQSRDTWGGGSKTFVYNCSRIEKNFFLSSFSFLSFNKLDSESAAKQMKFNYNLGGITQRRREWGGGSILKGLVEPRVGRREQGRGGGEGREEFPPVKWQMIRNSGVGNSNKNALPFDVVWAFTRQPPSKQGIFEGLRGVFSSRESTSVSCRSVIVRVTIKGNTIDFFSFFLRIWKVERGLRNNTKCKSFDFWFWKFFFFFKYGCKIIIVFDILHVKIIQELWIKVWMQERVYWNISRS